MTTFPKFSGFNITATDADVEAAKVKKFDGLTPGEHELEVLDIKLVGPTQSNPDWFRFQFQLGKPGSTELNDNGNFKGAIHHSVMIPTKDVYFVGKSGKPELFVFNMLSDFLIGFGIELKTSNVQQVISENFNETMPLKGRKLKAVIGYKSNYIDYRDGKYVLCDKDGKPCITSAPNEFANRASAEGQAITDGIEYGSMGKDGNRYGPKLEVFNVFPGEKPAAAPVKKSRAKAEW